MKIIFDGNAVVSIPGETILDVATRLGVEIPTLCHVADCGKASTSCLVCLVKVGGKFVPSCATKTEDGMVIESETDEVRKLRKSALELLLSDHSGDCYAPCQLACPAKLDIPKMLREIRAKNPVAAIRTIRKTIPLPAVLGRVCPKPCEKICRRKNIDKAVEICEMKRYVADLDLAAGQPYIPQLSPASGKRIVVIGAGPSGLSAAFYLTLHGHHVSLYAQGKKPGGRLRNMNEEQLPQSVLDAEIRTILSLPIDYYPEERLDWMIPESLAEIQRSFDAVLLCTGQGEPQMLENSEFETEQGRLRVDAKSFKTSIAGIFATGTAFRAKSTMIVRSVADGREAAESIDHFLRQKTGHDTGYNAEHQHYGVKLGKLSPEELNDFVAISQTKTEKTGEESDPVIREASRCLHCDCRGRAKCRLLKQASAYHADIHRFEESQRKPLQIRRSGNIVYEPGKCIKCGLCVSVTKSLKEEIGLTFFGRGFDVRIDVPFDEPIEKALAKSAAEAARVCPTAALTIDTAFQIKFEPKNSSPER